MADKSEKEYKFMPNLIDFKAHSIDIALNILLKDRTTEKNIIFATDTYKGVEFTTAVTKKLLLEDYINIYPRISKSLEEQTDRTRKKAEVFTPAWVCNKMNNHFDTEWFGRENVFNTEKENSWISTTEKIKFPKGKSWADYVNSKELEIACGEAPYIVSRYDATTGEIISIENRIGILDRKLRVINENVNTRKEWNKWVYRAFESVYGYEYQGDNLLIARINLLETFCEYTRNRWNEEPSDASVKRIANIISWNLWQMDGIRGVIPYVGAIYEENEYTHQMSLFELMGMSVTEEKTTEQKSKEVACKIYDWQNDESVMYKSIREGNNMRFDFVIGNPPYQETSAGDKPSDESLYHYFMSSAFEIADKVELITPARFLFNAGGTPKKWREEVLQDNHFKVLEYISDASNVFNNTDIKGGGVSIHYRDKNVNFGAIGIYTAFKELNSILRKVRNIDTSSITDIIYNQNKFNLNNLYEDFPDLKTIISSNGKEKRMTSSCIEYKCFHDEKQKETDISVLGLKDKQRVYRYINKKYVEYPHQNIDKYKVIVPANNGSGAIGEVLSTPLIGSPLIGYTQTFISVGAFDELNNAENALKYVKSKFCRVMLGILKVTQNGKKETWKYVPLQDFTSSSDIDWSQSIANIDKQLYKKYNLSDEEIDFIEKNVKEME